jgi:hypothetical protein
MPRTGRPPVFDNLKQQVYLRLLAGGYSPRDAARHVGVSASTVREKKRASPAFAAAYDEAKAQAVPTLLETIHQSGQRSWRASAWLLERLRPAQFGRRVALGVDPAVLRPPQRRRAYMDEEAINEFFGRLRGNPAAQKMSRQKLEEVEADQEAWDAAIRAYHEQYTLRGREPGFGPGEWSKPPDDLYRYSSLESEEESPHAADVVDQSGLSAGANNSATSSLLDNSQLEPAEPLPTTADAGDPRLSDAPTP